MAHLRDVIEARGMINVDKHLDICDNHIQFYVLIKYLFDTFFKYLKYRGRNKTLSLIVLYNFAINAAFLRTDFQNMFYRFVNILKYIFSSSNTNSRA